jgi:hypothetical protein
MDSNTDKKESPIRDGLARWVARVYRSSDGVIRGAGSVYNAMSVRARLASAAGLIVVLVIVAFWLSASHQLRPLIWKGFIFQSPSRTMYRTSLNLTRGGADASGKGVDVSGIWHQETWDGGHSVDEIVHGVLSANLLSLQVDSVKTDTPRIHWCSDYKNLSFLRVPFGDVATLVNEHWRLDVGVYPAQTAAGCESQQIVMLDISRPASLVSANAVITANGQDVIHTPRSLELNTQAAEERATAAYDEGLILDDGTFLGPHHRQAVAAYAQSAKNGYKIAKHLLGCMQPSSEMGMMAILKASWRDPKTAAGGRLFDLMTGGQSAKYDYYPFPTYAEVPYGNFHDDAFYCHVVFALGPRENVLGMVLNPELNDRQKAVLNKLPLDASFLFERIDATKYRVTLLDPELAQKYTATVDNPFGPYAKY